MALSALLLLGICGCSKKQSQKITDVKQSEKTEVVETPSVEFVMNQTTLHGKM